MKKLIALIAIVVLCGTFVYAAGITEIGNTTKTTNAGVFQATVIVPLTITQPDMATHNFGTFVIGTGYPIVDPGFTWTITGQNNAYYNVTFSFLQENATAKLYCTYLWNTQSGWNVPLDGTPITYPEQFGTNGSTLVGLDGNTSTDQVTLVVNSLDAKAAGIGLFTETVTVAYTSY
jgi:hypothetical protein